MESLIKFDNSKNNTTPEKRVGSKVLKLIMLIFVLVSITFLSSCFVPFPDREYEHHGENSEHHDNGNRGNHGNHGGEHHDNDEHHGHE